jgi:drug/metabolite transporter (DMT)-like permease
MLLFSLCSTDYRFRKTNASNSGFITGLFVAFVPILLRILFKRRSTVSEVIASLISLIGLWILTGGMKHVNWGDIVTLPRQRPMLCMYSIRIST